MRAALAILLLIVIALLSEAHALPLGAGTICPAGSPSPDGSTIGSRSSCVLIDFQGNRWRMLGGNLQADSGSGFNTVFTSPAEFQINASGRAFVQTSCAGGVVWLVNATPTLSGTNVTVPSAGLQANKFTDITQSVSANGLFALMNSGSVQANDHIVIGTLYPGGTPPIWFSAGRLAKSGLDIDLQGPMGCQNDEGNAILPVDTTGGPIDGLNIHSSNGLGELGFLHDLSSGSFRCMNFGDGTNWNFSIPYVHDCDFGLQGNTTVGNTSAHITNVVFDHNGANSSGGASATHNVYMTYRTGTTQTDQIIVSGGGSYCTNGHDGGGAGFMFKSRWPAGTFQNWTAAEPSQHGYTDCAESAAVDLPCGGAYVLGGALAGQGIVLEVGPNLQNTAGVIRYAQELTTGNCPGTTGWTVSSLVVRGADSAHKCWIINDSGVSTVKVVANAAGSSIALTVKNCNMVGIANGAFGNNVIDGGGNTFFANRAAAGLPAFPALPPPT